jgi:hypothetical protein
VEFEVSEWFEHSPAVGGDAVGAVSAVPGVVVVEAITFVGYGELFAVLDRGDAVVVFVDVSVLGISGGRGKVGVGVNVVGIPVFPRFGLEASS